MKYRVELRERDYLGPPIGSRLGEARYPSIVQAVHAAQAEAFEWVQRLGQAVAILVLHDEQVLARHLLPRPAPPAEPAPTGLGLRIERD